MKNIIKSTIFVFLLLTIVSCTENEKEPVVAANGFLFRVPAQGTSYVLLPENDAVVLDTLKWDNSNNGAPTASTYTIEIAKSGTNFANIINPNGGVELPSTNSFVWTVKQLNSLLTEPEFEPCTAADIDVRIKSTLGIGNNKFSQYSNVIKLNVTPYSNALPTLSFTKNVENPASSPRIASPGILQTQYEGYMNLLPDSYKFFVPDCKRVLTTTSDFYGDDDSGSFANLLFNGGVGIDVFTAGNYRVKANTVTTGTDALSYSLTPISAWGIIGDAKVIGTGNSLPAMTYDADENKYKITLNLKGGKSFRFRANNTNVILLGKYDATKIGDEFAGDKMSYNGLFISVPGIGTASYMVTLDLSNPRAYTYTLTPQ